MKFLFPFNSLRAGLLLTYLVLIAVSLGLLAWRVGASLDASRFSETQRDQEGRAILAASAANDWLVSYRDGTLDWSSLLQAVTTLSREISQPVAILDANGKTLVDAEHPDKIVEDDSHDPEVATAFSGLPGSAIRVDDDSGEETLFTVAPIHAGKELIGVVRLELSMQLVHQASQQFWFRIIGATLLAALVTVIVSLLFARALTEPLLKITHAAQAMAQGDLKQRIVISSPVELAQVASSFNYMAERLARVMQDQRAFVANAAHELRTPLTTIRLRADVLSDGAINDPEVASQFLSDITSESERLSRLVDQLLDLSRLESGLNEPRREPAALDAIARLVVRDLKPRAEQAGIAIQLDAPNGLPSVSVDPDQMRQVLINLLSNSLKFTPTGGTITISLTMLRRAQPDPNLPAGNWIVTKVSDSGEGIPAEDLPHIFERFYRSDKARARETGGAGLGLAIVKSIIEAHGGYIWAQSERGKGAQMTFGLPVA